MQMDSNPKQYYNNSNNYRKGYQGQGKRRYQNHNKQGGGSHYSQENYYQKRQYEYINPYMAQEMIYRTEMYIYTKYRNLIDINVRSQGLAKSVNENCAFFVIKSFSEEDVHKSIKYGVWSSSKNGNQALSNSFNLTKEKNGHVYLFFSCNGSGRFIGIARMKTACDENKSFDYWTQDGKWPGLFTLEWLFIKDVPFKEFMKIIITMKDGEEKPVSNARDTQEIPYVQAAIMVNTFEIYQNTNTILEHFEFYDLRQENYEKHLGITADKHMADQFPPQQEQQQQEQQQQEQQQKLEQKEEQSESSLTVIKEAEKK